jgi:hypothetical protein
MTLLEMAVDINKDYLALKREKGELRSEFEFPKSQQENFPLGFHNSTSGFPMDHACCVLP